MTGFTEKERFLRVLRKQKVDRPPVICTGGMMNAAIIDIMNQTGHILPDAHSDGELMAALAYDIHEKTGFENLGIPFDVTVEPQAMGSDIDFGTLSCEPKVRKEKCSSVSSFTCASIEDAINSSRIPAIVQAGYALSRKYADIPLIGNITGPITTSASVVDPASFLKELRRDRENSHRTVDCISDFLIGYARRMVDMGVDALCIGDPTASGEILGPKIFEEYAVRYLNKIIDPVRKLGKPVIVHICGDMGPVKHLIPLIRSDAISTDAMVNLPLFKTEYPQVTTMGNISTYLLEFGTADKVAAVAQRLVQEGVDIISPACGLSTSTSLTNIRAMTRAVKRQ